MTTLCDYCQQPVDESRAVFITTRNGHFFFKQRGYHGKHAPLPDAAYCNTACASAALAAIQPEPAYVESDEH